MGRAEKEFLDPRRLLVDETADWLCGKDESPGRLRKDPSGAWSLSHVMVVVPTAQAGRRLRRALADRIPEGLVPPMTVTPGLLLDPEIPEAASEAEELAAMAETLSRIELPDFRSLFPVDPVERSVRWSLDTAESILAVSRLLGENALMMSDVQPETEKDRWKDLAAIEKIFSGELARAGLIPRQLARKKTVAAGCTDPGIGEIVLPGLADVQPALEKYLLASDKKITLLLHADSDDGAAFDAWGRPVGDFSGSIPTASVFPAPDAVVESDEIASFFRSVKEDEALPALAVCDADMIPELEGAFQNRFGGEELVLRNPSKSAFVKSSLGRLVLALHTLAEEGDYETFSAFVRSGDAVRWLGGTPEISRALGMLDAVQNAHLPRTVGDVKRGAEAEAEKARGEEKKAFVLLADIAHRVENSVKDPFALLPEIFSSLTLDERRSSDRELVTAAEVLRDVRAMCASAAVPEKWRRHVFMKLLKGASYMLEPTEKNVLAVDGWLEIPWCADQELVIAGFNEGCVPESVVGHPFLPDSLRARLGLVTNEMRGRRDAFIFAEAVASRRPGAVRVHLHQIAGDKNVMKPSRLLFSGVSDAELPAFAMRLYTVAKGGDSVPEKSLPPAWKLKLPYPPAEYTQRERLAPTRLDQYLRSPFGFFLQEVFGEPSSDDAHELDALAFGNLCHDALDNFAKHGPKDSVDAGEIAAWLESAVWESLKAYGDPLPAIIGLQGEAAVARLRAFAPHQAARRGQGWRIIASEQSLECTIKSAKTVFRGKVDRIDENEHTGDLEIIDYKTWDRAKEDKVKSLQLPLYRAMVEVSGKYDRVKAAESRAMYCILARRPEDVKFDSGNAFHAGMQSEAEDQIERILDRIARGIFVPGKTEELPEEYRKLIWNSPEEGIDPEWLADQRRRAEEADDTVSP